MTVRHWVKRGRGCSKRVSSEHQLRFTKFIRIFREFDRKTRELSGEYLSSVSLEILRTFLFNIREGKNIHEKVIWKTVVNVKKTTNDFIKSGQEPSYFVSVIFHVLILPFFLFFYFFHSFTFSISFWFLEWLNQVSSSRNKASRYQYFRNFIRSQRFENTVLHVTVVPERSFNLKSKYDSHQVFFRINSSWNFC